MLHVSLKLLLLMVLLAPVLVLLLGVWRRRWAAAAASEVLLASLLSVALFVILLVVGVGKLPVTRPLDGLLWVQVALSGAAAAAILVRRDAVLAALRGVSGGLLATWTAAGPLGRAVLLLGVLSQLTAFGYGHWLSPWTYDELSYHIPQALQPYQDGRIGPVQTAVPWGDSYPRGAALLYAWTICLTGTDAAIHPVSATMGFVLMLATFVAARRLGLSPRWSAIATGLVPMAPIYFYLSINGYIDLIAGAMVGSALAFAMPQRATPGADDGAGGGWGWGSCLGCLMALMLALWMKVTPAPIAGLLLGVWGVERLVRAWLSRTRGLPAPRPGPVVFAAAGVLMLALAAIPYAQTWSIYGSPTYPQQVTIGPVEVFPGPMIAGSYLPHDVHVLTHFRKYVEFWTEWYTWIQIDSRGGLGPLFALAMLPAALVCMAAYMRPRSIGWLILGLASLAILILPVHFVPRYGIWVLLPGAVFAARLGEGFESGGAEGRRLASSWAATLLVLQIWNAHLVVRWVRVSVAHHLEFKVPLLTEHRTRVVQDMVQRDQPDGPTPATRRFVYERMPDRATLVTAVRCHHTLFYDPDYRYRVEHRPVRPWGWVYEWPDPRHEHQPLPEGPEWVAGLHRDGVAMVMAYLNSPEDLALRPAESGYRLIYEQPPEDGPVVRVYERAPAAAEAPAPAG